MWKFKLLPAGIAVVLLAGCNTPEEQQAFNAAAGALIGAGVGMAVSNEDDELKGALIGAGTGALLANALSSGTSVGSQPAPTQSTANRSGGQLGDLRTRAILNAHENAMRIALDTSSHQRWSSYGVIGNIYPTTQWEQNGQFCRGFDSVWTDNNTGERGNFNGSACRQPNGSWSII